MTSQSVTRDDIQMAIALRLLDRLSNVDPEAAARAQAALGSDLSGRGDPKSHVVLHGDDERQMANVLREAVSMVSLAAGVTVVENPDTDEVIAPSSLILVDRRSLDPAFYTSVIETAVAAARENAAVVCLVSGNFDEDPDRVRFDVGHLQAFAPKTSLVGLLNPPAGQGLDDFLNMAAHFDTSHLSPVPQARAARGPGI